MKNQIDEMAKDLCRMDPCEIKKIGIPCNHRCKAHIYATRAVDKGYRKASDVAREIFEELELKAPFFCENQIAYEHFYEELAELKKKYIGEDTNVHTNTEGK